ncbi:MAG: hypothetical protein HGA41_01465 [Syntrophaceae bacterium]|jgi:hypothetical protein|nr:hypothetical protein [Syntrophaceae bacterium]
MPKFTTRQIIILSVMVAVIVYAAYDFFIVPRAKQHVMDVGDRTAKLDAFINEVTTHIPKGSRSAFEVYTLGLAEAHWKHDPFYERKSYRDWVKVKEPAKAGGGAQKISFNYSGYVNMKDKRMAIINGVEYESGDPLEMEGYVLRGIYQNKVVIENVKNKSKFEVLLQE